LAAGEEIVTESAAPAPAAIRYHAFLSYSHADAAWAKWLHTALEAFRIEKDLIGRTTPLGPVPKTLRPIFRDREDFSGGHALTDATVAALDASTALIVLCSSTAANRPAVNEEVRLFRSRHPDRPVIPVIVEGSFPNNFPPALRHEIAPDGMVADRPITILGPDLRESGDGKMLGLAKVVAGLIGLPSDDIFRRAERARRRQARLRNGVIGMMLALMAGGGFFAWQSYQTRQTLADRQATLAEIEALVAKFAPVGSAQAGAPGAGASLTAAITAIANGATTDARYAKALDLLKAGKPAEAEPLLKAVADEKAARALHDAKQAAAAYANLGAVALLGDAKRAREYFARALELDPNQLDALYSAGWLEKEAGNLDVAERIYGRLIALKAAAPASRIYWAKLGLGDIRYARGDLAAALAAYREAQAERAADPDDAQRQRDLAVSHIQIGDVLVAQGKLADALASFRESLAINERLATIDAGNPLWQQDRAESHSKIGSVLMAQGKLADALASFRNSLAIAHRLARAEPQNTLWQRQRFTAYDNIGNALAARGDVDGAMSSFRDALAIAERLSAADPDNGFWAFNLGLSSERMGDLLLRRGDVAGALRFYQIKRDIIGRLVKSDPSNTGWQRDLSLANNKIGEVLRAQGKLAEALTMLRDSLAIRERLIKADPRNTIWQRDLAASHDMVGDVLRAQGAIADALSSYRHSIAIMEPLTQADPGNATWQRDLSVSYVKSGDLIRAQGKPPEALNYYRNAMAICERLVAADPNNPGWQRDLSVAYERIGNMLVLMREGATALSMYRASLAIAEWLIKVDPQNAGWQRDLSLAHNKVGEVLMAQGEKAEALVSYRAGLAVAERLAEAVPEPEWQSNLAQSYDKVGEGLVAQGEKAEAVSLFRTSLGIKERLAKASPGHTEWQWDLLVSHWRLASIGDEPARRWALIVAEMRKLKDGNRLRPDWARWLPAAEAELAKHQEAQAAPQ